MASRAGLVGVYQSPTLKSNISSVYMIADDNNTSLYIFVLFPGAYNDAYEIASCVWYRNIFIIPVSLDALYISDVARLVNDLSCTKPLVKVLFPGKFCAFVPTVVQKALINSERKTYYQYRYGFISFNYRMSEDITYQPNFYDIYATFKRRRCLFCPFEVNKERILKMLKDGDVDWVYVPYSDPMFGTDCYATLLLDPDFEDYMNKIIAFGFFNTTQANYCKGRYPKSFPRTIRVEFLRETETLENGTPPVIGGNPTWKPEDDFKDNLPERDEPEDTKPRPPFPKPLPQPEQETIKTQVPSEETLIEIPTEAEVTGNE